MANVNLTTFGYALQEYYDSRKIFDLIGRDHPFLADLMSRKVKTTGEVHVFPLMYSLGDGRSASFSVAQGNPAGTKGIKLKLNTVNDYALVRIDGEVLDASEGSNAAAFFAARTHEFDAKLVQLGNSLSHAAYRSGSGSIGQVSASQSGGSTTINLVNPDDIINFEVGQRIDAAATDGGGSEGTTISFIKTVDRVAGTFTVAATDGGAAITATASTLTASNFIFRDGDYGAKLSGLSAWIPSSVSGSDSFFGVNRSVDRQRLAGWYIDESTSGKPIEDSIIDAAKVICRFAQAKPDTVLISFADWAVLNKTLSSKVQYIEVKPGSDAAFFFQGMIINGPRGPLKVIPDSDMLPNELVVTQMDTWELIYKGKDVPMMLNYDGNNVLRVSDQDAIEARWGYRAQIACKAPAFTARVKLR